MKIIIFLSFPLLFLLQHTCIAQSRFINNTKYLQGDFFEENKGQVTGEDCSKVKFSYKGKGITVFLLNNAIAYQFNKVTFPDGYQDLLMNMDHKDLEKAEKLSKEIIKETFRMDVSLVNANLNTKITTSEASKEYIQYYNHNVLDVHQFQKVTYHNVYPNIDWVFYKEKGNLKYDFLVHPGGDPSQIKMEISFSEDFYIEDDGSLTMKTIMGSIHEKRPISFQGETIINTNFSLNKNFIQFDVEDYNKNKTLRIDPTIEWATYYGGPHIDKSTNVLIDKIGDVYMSGSTHSDNFIANGGFQNTKGGNYDAYIVKFNSSGTRLWSTYYGGGMEDKGLGLAVDNLNNIYLVGSTRSIDNISFNGFQNSNSGQLDAFIVKFNESGARLWGSYFGSNGNDLGFSVNIDNQNNVYMAGHTNSQTNIASGGHQNIYGGGYNDAFVLKIDDSANILWSSYYGGSGNEYSAEIKTDPFGNVFLGGRTNSLSNISFNGHQSSYGGDIDAYIVKFDSLGNRKWGSYYGGNQNDYGFALATDYLGNVYLGGTTRSSSGISTTNAHQPNYAGNMDAFIVKFDSLGSRSWGSYYGGSVTDGGNVLSVDYLGNVFLGGTTNSTSSIAYNGYQNALGGGTSQDSFVAKFNKDGVLRMGTYYGGEDNDGCSDISIDSLGNLYLTGNTKSLMNMSHLGYQNQFEGLTDAFLVKLNQCYETSIDSHDACSSFVWIDGNEYNSDNSSAIILLTSTQGCDSIVTLNLIINQTDLTISTNDSFLSVNEPGGSYQWLNCDSSYLVIPSATNQDYTPITNGNYAAEITSSNGCIDTTSCSYVGFSYFLDYEKEISIEAYPNPATNFFKITKENSFNMKIYDITGKLLASYFNKVSSSIFSLSDFNKGIYLLEIESDNMKSVIQIVKE